MSEVLTYKFSKVGYLTPGNGPGVSQNSVNMVKDSESPERPEKRESKEASLLASDKDFKKAVDYLWPSKPSERLSDQDLTEAGRREAAQAIVQFMQGHNAQLTPGAAMYLATRQNTGTPMHDYDFVDVLRDEFGKVYNRKGIKSSDITYAFGRMNDMPAWLTNNMNSHAWKLRGSGLTDQKNQKVLARSIQDHMKDFIPLAIKDIGGNEDARSSIFDNVFQDKVAKQFTQDLKTGFSNRGHQFDTYNTSLVPIMYYTIPEFQDRLDKAVGGFVTEDPRTMKNRIEFLRGLANKVDTSKLTPEQQAFIFMASKSNHLLQDDKIRIRRTPGARGVRGWFWDIKNSKSPRDIYINTISRYMGNGMSQAVQSTIANKFKNEESFRNHYLTDQYLTDTMNKTLGQFNGFLDNTKDFEWDYNNLIVHTVLYNNLPRYRKMFDDKFGSAIGGRINENTTPEELQALYDQLNGVSFNKDEMDKAVQELKDNPTDAMPILAAMYGDMSPDVDAMKNTVMAGHRAAGTAGATNAFKKHGLFWKNPREWVVFAHRNKIGNVPDWFGNLAQNRAAFWGTLVGGGALAVGGLALLVSSFLNSQKDEEDEEELASEAGNDPQRQRKPYIPNTTSMWRAGTNAY